MQTTNHVLIIEDNPGDAGLCVEYFEQAQTPGNAFEVVHVRHLQGAGETLNRQRFDAILLDLHLPDGSGVDSVNKVRTSSHGAPLIVLTGDSDEHLARQCLDAGAQDFLPKSDLNQKSLVRAVTNAMIRKKDEDLRQAVAVRQNKRYQLTAEISKLFCDNAGSTYTRLERFSEHCARTIGDACAVFTAQPDDETYQFCATHGCDPDSTELMRRYVFGKMLPAGIVSLESMPNVAEEKLGSFFPAGTLKRALIEPIRVGDQCLGGVCWLRLTTDRVYEFEDRALLADVALRVGYLLRTDALINEHHYARKAAESAARNLRQLSQMADALAAAVTPDEVAATIQAHIFAVFGAAAVGLRLMNDSTKSLTLLKNSNLRSTSDIAIDAKTPSAIACVERRILIFESSEQLTSQFPTIEFTDGEPVPQACLAVPLFDGDDIVGAITATWSTARLFSQKDRSYIAALQTHCSHALIRARMIERRKSAAETSNFFAQVGEIASSGRDVTRMLNQLVEASVPYLGDWCMLETFDESDLEDIALATANPTERDWAVQLRLNYGAQVFEGLFHAIQSGKPVLLKKVTADILERLAPIEAERERIRQLKIHSMIIVPLVLGSSVIGGITLATNQGSRIYNDSDLTQATEFARRCVLAIENARLYRRLNQAIEARDDFLAAAGHELKTPLAALVLQTQNLQRVARKMLDAAKIETGLEKSLKACHRLEKLINQLLDVSRITAGRMVLECETVNLASLLVEVIERFQPQGTTGRIQFDLPQDTNVTVKCDKFRIDQVLTNLVSNALKYGLDKEVTVTLQSSADSVSISVQDRGIGISPEHRPKLFQRFERTVAAREFGGLGLGLWIAHQIVTASHGSIDVDSYEGQGSTFVVTLPRVLEREDVNAAAS